MADSNEVGNAFAAALKRMLKDKPGATITSAAKELQVSRQMFHSYLQGTLPRRKTFNKAVRKWNLTLDIGGHSFNKDAFGSGEKKEQPTPKATQPTLWEAIDAVSEKDLHVTMKRVGKVLRVDVRIEIPA